MGIEKLSKPVEILILEDDPNELPLIQLMLGQAKNVSFHVTIADSLPTGIKYLRGLNFDIIILDLNLKNGRRPVGFNMIQSQVPNVPVLLLSDEGEEPQGLRIGIVRYRDIA